MSESVATPAAEVEVNAESAVGEAADTMQGLSDGIDLDDSQEVSEDSIDQAEANGQISAQQAQALKKTLKIKVDGREMEETLDFNDEEGLKRYVQKAKAFDKRNQEFVQYKSQMDQLVNLFKEDPALVMEKLGLDPDEFSQKRLEKRVEELKKSPEQVEREKMQKELEDLRNEKKRIEEEKQHAEMERLRNEASQQIENDISKALDDAKSILPKKNPLVLQRIANTMLSAIDAGYADVTAADVIPIVEKQFRNELNELFKVIPDDVFESLTTKERLDAYRKNKVAAKPQVKKAQTTTARQLTQDGGSRPVEDLDDKPKNKSTAAFKKMFSFQD